MKRTVILAGPLQRRTAAAYLAEAPDGYVMTLREPNRTTEQNAKFHSLCSDLEKARVPWAGKPRDASAWKVLLVSGNAVATKEGSEIVPGLEGEFINLRESTALMSKKRGSSLIEYSVAFCESHGIKTAVTAEPV